MGILVGKNTRLVVQGITGREGSSHADQMLEYGTNIVAGVTPGRAGQMFRDKVPMVVRMAGTQAEAGLKLLEGSALVPEGNPVEAARKIIALAKGA